MIPAHWLVAGYLPSAILLAGWAALVWKRGATSTQTAVVIASFVVGLSVGMVLIPDVLGGILGGLGVALLAQAVLGGKLIPYRELAWALPATVAVGRVGCFLSGCCFGTPTDLPWGVVHEAGSLGHGLHAALGYVEGEAPASLPTHPYPLYDAVGLVLWAPLIGLMARRTRAAATPLLATLGFDFFRRAGLDGTRAMLNVELAVFPGVGPLDAFRVTLLAVGLATAWLAVRAEKRARNENCARSDVTVSLPRLWLMYGVLAVLVALSDHAQTRFLHGAALLALLLVFAASLVETVHAAASSCPRAGWLARPRLAAAVGLVAATWTGAHLSAAVAGEGSRLPTRAWMYEVHPSRAAIVRVGSEGEPAEAVLARRLRLGLPSFMTSDNEASSAADVAVSKGSVRVWLGAEGIYEQVSFVRENTCSDESVLIDHSGYLVGGRVEVDWEAQTGHELRLGLRGGYGRRETFQDGVRQQNRNLGLGQVWVGYRNRFMLAEIGAVVTNAGANDGVGASPAGRLRFGSDVVGGEIGFADSASPMGLVARLAVTGNLYRASGIPLSYDFGFITPSTYIDTLSTQQLEVIRPSLKLTFEPYPSLRVFGHVAGANTGFTAGGGVAFQILD